MRAPVEDRAPDLDVAERLGCDLVGIRGEHREVRALARADRADLVFQPQTPGRLQGDGAERALEGELDGIREKGIFKEERFIHSPQSARIDVEYPAGSSVKPVLNLCSNNYLGLSSHPDVVAAAHAALDERGYGMYNLSALMMLEAVRQQMQLAEIEGA